MLATLVMKLNPIHRNLSRLEMKNIRDFFSSDLISPLQRRTIGRVRAFWMTLFQAVRRTARLTRSARQDYYALQRQGCFVADELPQPTAQCVANAEGRLPVLIVPGLNTPPVFFREMQAYFTERRFPTFVMDLPKGGLAEIAASADALREEVARVMQLCGATQVNIVGHCLGGLIAHYWLEHAPFPHGRPDVPPVKNLVSLGTGYMGAAGVRQLKQLWAERNAGKTIPSVFDELVEAQMNRVHHSRETARHSLLTIWDFMVHFRKGILDARGVGDNVVSNVILDDPDIDHLTLALNPKVFQRIESILAPGMATA